MLHLRFGCTQCNNKFTQFENMTNLDPMAMGLLELVEENPNPNAKKEGDYAIATNEETTNPIRELSPLLTFSPQT